MDNFVDTHPMRSAFIGNRLQRLVDTISEQGDALLDAQGLKFRAAACSTVRLAQPPRGARRPRHLADDPPSKAHPAT